MADATLTTVQMLEAAHLEAVRVRALLETIAGSGQAHFQTLSDAAQDAYVWTCLEMTDRVVNQLDAAIDQAASARKSALLGA